jgi:hypothetical protein
MASGQKMRHFGQEWRHQPLVHHARGLVLWSHSSRLKLEAGDVEAPGVPVTLCLLGAGEGLKALSRFL